MIYPDRRRFAFLPVRIWAEPNPYTKPKHLVWLVWVVESFTRLEGWIAYEHKQN